MINPGDKVKIVDCRLCGGHCWEIDGVYRVIRTMKRPHSESKQQIDLYGIDNTRSGLACAIRIRKVYD